MVEPIEITRWFAAILVIAASLMVAWGEPARLVMWGFVTFSVASILWIGAAAVEAKWALAIQNGVLLFVNLWGVKRWLRRVRREGPERAPDTQPAE